MKFLLVLVACVLTVASGKQLPPDPLETTAYDYHRRFGIPLAEKIIAYEEQIQNDPSRIVGGAPAALGQFPHQAGLRISFAGSTGVGVCGASLVSHRAAVTAAHCWFDGVNQASELEVRLASVLWASGGHVERTSNVIMHPSWTPSLIRNDVAMIRLNSLSGDWNNVMRPIPLPHNMGGETFNGVIATASGFGLTQDGGSISTSQYKSFVHLNVISNTVCSFSFPFIVQSSNICTSGAGGVGTCGGDSGGPLTTMRNGHSVLIGITSFGSARGCQVESPAAFARVTSFMDFIESHL